MKIKSEQRLFSVPQACAALGGIGRTMIYDLIASGDLQKVNIGRRGLITAKSIDAYVSRLSSNA